MLHREYVPFLPTLESEPQGPVDHPMLEASAPPGWWEDSAQELFGAAEHIGKILCEASECGVHLMTPFAGFCAFSAGYVNLYAYRFPRMNLNRSPGAEKCLNMCLDYLHEFSRVWRIADGWVRKATKLAQHVQGLIRQRRSRRYNMHHSYTNVHRRIENVTKEGPEPTLTLYINLFTSFAWWTDLNNTVEKSLGQRGQPCRPQHRRGRVQLTPPTLE